MSNDGGSWGTYYIRTVGRTGLGLVTMTRESEMSCESEGGGRESRLPTFEVMDSCGSDKRTPGVFSSNLRRLRDQGKLSGNSPR